MGSVNLLPVGDWRNDGWTLVGASTLYSTWDNDNDAIYASCPATKGGATVTFPIDFSSVPDGAVVTSVTVNLKAAKTAGSGQRSVTVNVISADDEARYTSRTIYPTTTITTYEVATYDRDPRGEPWDVHRFNKMRFRVFSYSRISGAIRCYKFFATVNYRVRPTITVDQPTGTVYSPSPTVVWTYSQSDGDAMSRVDMKVFTSVQVQDVAFNPNSTPPVYATSVTGEVSSAILGTSLNPDTYYVYLRAVSVFGASSTWVGRTFVVQGSAPAIPGNDNAGSGGTPGVGVPTVTLDSATSSALVTFRDASNLLSMQSGDFENLVDPIGYITTNCTAVRDSATWYGIGQASMRLTASSAATMSVLSNDVEIAESTPVTAKVQVRTAVTARTVNLRILFYDELFASLGSTVSASGTDASTTWTEITATGTSPAGTAYAKVQVEVASPANAEVHYVDHVGLMYGTGSAWSDGGFLSRNILSSFLSTGDDPAAASGWVAGNVASSVAVVTTSGTGSNGSKTNRMTYNGASASIAFRATGTTFNSATSGVDFTLNKPAGLANNDLLIAYLSAAGTGTVTPPSGWTLVDQVTADANHSMWVLKRTGLAADPATWTANLSAASNRRSAVVVAYSGAADVDSQFLTENVRADPDGALVHTSAVVSNTDPNAWRACAFSWRDNVSGGTAVANITPPAYTTPIQYVGKGSKWSQQTATTSYTINRPTGVKSGDLMIAVATFGGSITTVTPPSGWTLVRQATQTDGTGPCTFAVFKRTAGGSEPTSWSGTLSSSSRPTITQSVAYRNCKDASLQFINDNTSTLASGDTITTATVNNTTSNAWRISAFGMTTDEVAHWASSSEVIERSNDHQFSYTPVDVNAAIYDSNGPVGTGNHARTATSERDVYAAVAWIGIIAGLDTPPAPGANETERADLTVGAADPWQTMAVYDSNAVIPTGSTSVTGVLTPGSGSSADSGLSWIGIIRPAAPVVAGTVAAYTSDKVDISLVDPTVLDMAGKQVTFTAAFLGNVSGTPYLTLDFYRANVLLATRTAEGEAYNSTVWTKSAATFDIPEGTTRIRPQVSSRDRAVSDTVSFDKIGLAFGNSTVWREGTGRPEHPVWSIPQIQYADDDGSGYGEWQYLPGTLTNPPQFDLLTGQVLFRDHLRTPLNTRKYRVQTKSFGLLGDTFVSGWGPASADSSLVAVTWWLKDPSDPTKNIPISVMADPTPDISMGNTAAVFHTLGSKYPKVVTEGYKADTIPVDILVERDEHVPLRSLLESGKTLFLVSDVDESWWVRPVGDLSAPVLDVQERSTNPRRIVSVTFVEVAPEG